MSIDLTNLIGGLYEGAGDADGIMEGLKSIATVIDSNGFTTQTVGTETPEKKFGAGHGLDEEMYGEHFTRFSKTDPWLLSGFAMTDILLSDNSSVYIGSEFVPMESVKKTEWARELGKDRLDVLDCALVPVLDDFGSITLVSFLRPNMTGIYQEPEKRLLRSLAPHIRNALKLNSTVASLVERERSLLDHFDSLNEAVFTLDVDGRLISLNGQAQELLQDSDLIAFRNGVMASANKEISNALQEIRQFLSRDAGHANWPTFTRFGVHHHGLLYSAKMTPSGQPLDGVHNRSHFILSFSGPFCKEVGARSLSVLQNWGLTHTEASVAALLATGITAQEVATQRGSSFETVRWHIKRIFEKLDLNSQNQLVGLINQIV